LSPAAKRRPPPTRRQRLDLAAQSLKRGRARQALEQYLGLLDRPDPDPAFHVKAAELFIRLKQPREARVHFEAAARVYATQGFDQRQLGVYRTAVAYLPRDVELWERIAIWQCEHGYRAEAVRILREARRTFQGRKFRAEAIRVLRGLLALEPEHLDATFDLARLLARTGGRAEARQRYEEIARRGPGPACRRARRALFFLSPTPAAAWRWLCAITAR
jgi:tetratricopeptide (TPR) repeat protein